MPVRRPTAAGEWPMVVSFHQILVDAALKNWCVKPFCTTCGCLDFRSAVSGIPNLQRDFESLDFDALIPLRGWDDGLRVVCYDHRLSLDWGRILSRWLTYAKTNPRFADLVVYYLLDALPAPKKIRVDWVSTCVDLAVTNRDISLLESLIRRLGSHSAQYPILVSTALEQSPSSGALKHALVKAGYLELAVDLDRKRKQKTAGLNLFGAIRRNDARAIVALLRKEADVFLVDKDGRTPVDLAEALGRDEVARLLRKGMQYAPTKST
jgi:hypothetical protein